MVAAARRLGQRGMERLRYVEVRWWVVGRGWWVRGAWRWGWVGGGGWWVRGWWGLEGGLVGVVGEALCGRKYLCVRESVDTNRKRMYASCLITAATTTRTRTLTGRLLPALPAPRRRLPTGVCGHAAGAARLGEGGVCVCVCVCVCDGGS